MNNMPYMIFVVEADFDTAMGTMTKSFYFLGRDEAEKFRRKGAPLGIRVTRLIGKTPATYESAYRSITFERQQVAAHLHRSE